MPSFSPSLKLVIVIFCVLLLGSGVAITLYKPSTPKSTTSSSPTPSQSEGLSSQSDYQTVKNIVESVLNSQTPLANGERVPANSRLNSLLINPDEIVFDFSAEILSAGQDTFSLTFSRIDNALQKDWRSDAARNDASLPIFVYRILINNKPLEVYVQENTPQVPQALSPDDNASQSEN